MTDEKNVSQSKRFGEEDMIELCGLENIIVRDDELWEFGAYKNDAYGFKINIEFMIIEQSCTFGLKYLNNKKSVFFVDFEHIIDSISREGTTLKFQLTNPSKSIIFSFEPNFSLKLPELSIRKNNPTKPLDLPVVFSLDNIKQLFDCKPAIDANDSISFSTTNSIGFTLFVVIYPKEHKCFVRLSFIHYQTPVLEVIFSSVERIDCDLTEADKKLMIFFHENPEPINICFNPTFSMSI